MTKQANKFVVSIPGNYFLVDNEEDAMAFLQFMQRAQPLENTYGDDVPWKLSRRSRYSEREGLTLVTPAEVAQIAMNADD